MLLKFTLFSAIVIFCFSSCTKQLSQVSDNSSLSTLKTVTPLSSLSAIETDRGWYGFYGGDFASDTLFAPDIIKGGVAQLPFYSNSSDLFTGLAYDILSSHVITGDSVVYEVRIKNPKDSYHSDWDVLIALTGSANTAYVHFVADNSLSQYTEFYVGSAVHDGLQKLVYDFEDFKTIRLALKNNKASLYLNDKLLYSFVYGANNAIGQIKTIHIGGKGYMATNAVRLYNSYTGTQILSENFNTDGQSTVVYH